jgi:NAD(P)-dependent dehydrogenase (short-subunit alcohol dehydrogenase family)
VIAFTADLSGRAGLVFGASRGLGREAALALARAGADIACAARTRGPLEEAAGQIMALGRRASVCVVDVADASAVAHAVDEAAAGFGRLDLLVYAAGMIHASPALDTTLNDWERVLRVNLTGAFVACREAARHMKAGGGRMVLFGTSFVGRALPLTVAYNVAKAGLHQLVQHLAVEWARYGITVNAIAPGYFETEMPAAVLGDPDLRSRVLGRIPLRRIGRPEEIGPLVVYLVSPESGFVTGAIVRIDGGQSLNVS